MLLINALSKIKHNKKHCHEFTTVVKRSNALQLDDMGYPLRLCIVKCKHCDCTTHMWLDVSVEEYKETETGESFLLKWK